LCLYDGDIEINRKTRGVKNLRTSEEERKKRIEDFKRGRPAGSFPIGTLAGLGPSGKPIYI